MKKAIILLLIACFVSCVSYADSSYISTEAILNKSFDSGNNAIKATISGTAAMTSITVLSSDGVSANKVVGMKTISMPVTNPEGIEDFLVWRSPWTITVTSINGVCSDGTSLTCSVAETDGDGVGRTALGPQTAVGTTSTGIAISNDSVDAGDYLAFVSTAEAGDVTKMVLSVEYTVD